MRVHRRVWTGDLRWVSRGYYWGRMERIVGSYNATGSVRIGKVRRWLRQENPR